MSLRLRRIVAVGLATTQLAWLDPHALPRQGSRDYVEGRYDEAAEKYNQALIDDPDSPLLRYNLGAILYKQGKFADAAASFEKIPATATDAKCAARAAYNFGNAKFREGQATAESDPKNALAKCAEALVAYRRAMSVDADDLDVKLNHEFVEKTLKALEKKLEEKEQQQQQEGEQREPPQDEAGKQEDGEQKQEPKAGAGDDAKEEAPEAEKQPGDAAGREEPRKDGSLSQEEAAALLDSERDQEVRPDEMTRRLQGVGVGEAVEDW